MSDIKVTQETIHQLMQAAEVETRTAFGKCTVMCMKLPNGFILTESSACVDPANYDPDYGAQLCREHIENRLWELEGYALQKKLHEQGGPEMTIGDFGWALNALRMGQAVRRRGWNGEGIFIKLQKPDEDSKMTGPYIYIDTTGLKSMNPEAPRSCVPWLASQTDMLAEDWELYW